MNCIHSFRTKNKLETHRKVCENKAFCKVVMPFEDTKILEFNMIQKSDKALFFVYANLESSVGKIGGCKNNPE